MTYLSPEIEAKSKHNDSNSLIRPGVSCGIFQDCNPTEKQKIREVEFKSSSKFKSK